MMRLGQRIRVMPPDLALKIAAGEVVERPASVVKELLDNSIDAGADTVKVEIRDAGLKLISVSDNGCGIPSEDLPLAFTSHATSKIGDLNDLEHLLTLGFRGEALPSIAAVARVEVQTAESDAARGSRLLIEHGKVLEQKLHPTPPGLRITVSDLFSNVPARRKFVRSLRAESGQIQQVVMQYSLAQPQVRFALAIDDRLTFHSPGSGRLEDAFAAVYGAELVDKMTEVHREADGITLDGLTSTPSLNRQNRLAINIIVNGRPIQNRSLAFALEEAYSGFLMVGRHPIAVIHISLPPGEVDVNIHPAKSQVRFARDREVHGAVHRAISQALLNLPLQPRSLSLESSSLEPLPVDLQPPDPLQPQDDSGETPTLIPGLPSLRVFGQANQMFIIAEGPDGLYLIDQHAAHERVIFDQLEEQLSRHAAPSQPLIEPIAVQLTPGQMTALEGNTVLLEEMGFALEPFGKDASLVRAVPVLARTGNPATLLVEVLDELQISPQPDSSTERALAALSCAGAVKAGQSLEVQEMRELVVQLERTVRPSTCPHGRPTMIHLSHSQLERQFGRI
jgi:DNA mismatch repair protein MutL